MASWNRVKQSVRETFNAKDSKTEIPVDIGSLVIKGQGVSVLYEHVIESASMNFAERKVKTKHADDPTKMQPMYALANSIKSLSAEYVSDQYSHEYLASASNTLMRLAEYKADVDGKVVKVFIEPKRVLLKDRIGKADEYHESLKNRRMDLDAKKHKLKLEQKSLEPTKIKKYEFEVQDSQEKFDIEADSLRELLQPLSNDAEMGREQCAQTKEMIRQMREYHMNCLQALEDHEKRTQDVKPPSPVMVQQNTPSKLPSIGRTPSIQHAASAPFRLPVNNSAPALSAKPVTAVKPILPPVATKPRALGKCCALYEFVAEQADDLDFVEGDLITILSKDGDWWKGKNIRTGGEGNFPANYVKML
eukprot:Partr_v1_DN28859_c1_g1_i2_m32971 putative SH3-domain GRB2-like